MKTTIIVCKLNKIVTNHIVDLRGVTGTKGVAASSYKVEARVFNVNVYTNGHRRGTLNSQGLVPALTTSQLYDPVQITMLRQY